MDLAVDRSRAGLSYTVGRCALPGTGRAVGDGGYPTTLHVVVMNIDPTADPLLC